MLLLFLIEWFLRHIQAVKLATRSNLSKYNPEILGFFFNFCLLSEQISAYPLSGPLKSYFVCNIPQIDPHTKDLARGNYMSYDPDLWKNPNPVSYHFVVPENQPQDHIPLTYTTVKTDNGEERLYKDDITESSMLHMFCTSIISDRSVLNILRKRWENDDRSKGRNNKAFSYLGIFCKAGIPKTKAIEFVVSLFPTWTSAEEEVTHAAGWAYTHNPFGCDRMKFKPHK